MRVIVLTLVAVLAACGPASPARAEVVAYEGTIELPTYSWDPAVGHPYFPETDGRNIYPYPMMDNLSRERSNRVWRTVVLENEYLRAVFLPELGGKVYEVFDKKARRQVFYVNHVVKPGLIGQCGAWVSGGIEFNTGPQGHTVSAVLPVDVQILPRAADGSRSVAVGEVERIYRTRWTVVVTLRPGRSYLEETVRIYNRTEWVRPYYFWNCTAVPNTPGFRFVYPMTLGTDHAGTTFYTWPISEGTDLSYGRNYQDAASIFAYECDQDFFGSYDEDVDYGVVACANHRILPGKKAWTWGLGGYGTMHQMDLTDDDGPYNEVQTGPLPTQADVGRLDPHEAICWKEWWYPVTGIGVFTYANRDLAVNAVHEDGVLRVRIAATGSFADVQVYADAQGRRAAAASLSLAPGEPAEAVLRLGDGAEPPFQVMLQAGERNLGVFSVPLDLPKRTPPGPPSEPDATSELIQAGWMDLLFARYEKAESRLREALSQDPAAPDAQTGLAYLQLGRSAESAADLAKAALAVDPDHGLARYVSAQAAARRGSPLRALDEAWRASTDPSTAVPARALAGKLLLKLGRSSEAAECLAAPGPWREDPVAANYLALALWAEGKPAEADRLARRNLDLDPLDALARSVLWLTGAEDESMSLARLVLGNAQSVLELASTYSGVGLDDVALRVLERFYLDGVSASAADPMVLYWAAWLCDQVDRAAESSRYRVLAAGRPSELVFPHREESVPVLRWALSRDPEDGRAALYLGHLLFALRRYDEARELWERATTSAQRPVEAFRALGLARWKLDGDVEGATELLRQAAKVDSGDVIVARDFARALFELASRAKDGGAERALLEEVRSTLVAALPGGRGRSDFVALLARAHNRLGDYAATARLLDSVRITIWEGAREAHDLFEEAHLELGKSLLEAGRAGGALEEFDRALEYPENLATGRLEGAREAHIHLLRGRALAALGRMEEARAAWRAAADEEPSKDPRKEEARRLAQEALEALPVEGSGLNS